MMMLLYHLVSKGSASMWNMISLLDIVGMICSITGIIFLSVIQQKLSNAKKALTQLQKKYRYGAIVFIFPLIYAISDALAMVVDGVLLDEDNAGIGQVDYLIIYGICFVIISIAIWIYLLIRQKKPYNPFRRSEWSTLVPISTHPAKSRMASGQKLHDIRPAGRQRSDKRFQAV